MTATVGGEALELKGTTTAFLSNNSSLLTFNRNSYAGKRDPESQDPLSTVRLIFEKTKGLKPFVLPSVTNSQERRAELDVNGIQYRSSITTAKEKSDTFAYADGRVKGVWTFEAPAGAANQALKEIVLTVDLAVPAEIR